MVRKIGISIVEKQTILVAAKMRMSSSVNCQKQLEIYLQISPVLNQQSYANPKPSLASRIALVIFSCNTFGELYSGNLN